MERRPHRRLTPINKPEGTPRRIIPRGTPKRRRKYPTVRLLGMEVEGGHDRHGSKPLFGTPREAVAGCL